MALVGSGWRWPLGGHQVGGSDWTWQLDVQLWTWILEPSLDFETQGEDAEEDWRKSEEESLVVQWEEEAESQGEDGQEDWQKAQELESRGPLLVHYDHLRCDLVII